MTDQEVFARAVIVDDEEPARWALRQALVDVGGVEVVGECANGFEAVKAVAELQPGVVLLDVQMPKLDGFEVLELIGREIPVVFVTAYDEFALRAFDVHAVDYLLKPFSTSGWPAAIERVRQRQGGPMPACAALAASARPPGRHSSAWWCATVPRCTCCRSTGSTTSRRRTTMWRFIRAGRRF